MLTGEGESYEVVRQLAAGVVLDQALDAANPDSWIRLDLAVRELARQRPELFHSNASPYGRQLSWRPDAALPTVTWQHRPDDTELALAFCHPDGRIREAALDHAERRPALLALVVIRCTDWAAPVRERARVLLSETPPDRLAAHAALILQIGRRPRGGFAQELLTGALRAGPAAQAEALLDSGDRATARLAYRIAVERRLLPATRLAQTAARHHDVVVQNLCAEAAVATLTEGSSDEFSEVVVPLLGSRQPRVRSAGVTALRRAGRHADAEPYLTDRSAVVRACARWVLRQDGVPLRGVADHVLGTRRSSPYRRGPGMSTALTAGQLCATRMPCPTVRPMHGLPERVKQGRLHHEAGHDLRQGGIEPAPRYRALCTDPVARPAAAAGLGECKVPEDANLIRALLAHPAPGVRAYALAGLRALDAVRVQDIRPLLDDPSAAVVRQATAALLPWADHLPQELLHGLLTEDRPRHQRIAAVRLLRAVGVHAWLPTPL
ncbi:hypothetical protein AB0M86_32150 [Streptomyces sp. NPDC051639]|uniref:hypothetical protein n=1 Tax=Streptomyces sp. NPDC051639 TaxID=3155671 RepID=UPI00344AE44E